MSVKSSISLTDQQAAFARQLVERGRYSSLSAVMQHGLDLLRQQTERQDAETEALRLLIEQRWGGEFIADHEMKDRLSEMAERKRREHGLGN